MFKKALIILKNLSILKNQEGVSFFFKKSNKKNTELTNALKILTSGYFDYKYYLKKYPEISHGNPSIIEAAIHYNTYGWKDAKKPSELIDNDIFIKYNDFFNKKKTNLLLEFINKKIKLKNSDLKNLYLKKNTKDEFKRSKESLTHFLSYKNWILENEIKNVHPYNNNIQKTIKISICIDASNLNYQLLKKCINSLLSQSYSNFEIIIQITSLNDDQESKKIFTLTGLDNRIKITTKTVNQLVITINSDWLLFINHYDELQKDALLQIAVTVKKQPEVELIYSDDDYINDQGERHKPHFKSDFNLDLFYSQDYISNSAAYKVSSLTKINFLGISIQNNCYSLLLPYLKHINYQNIYHIPKILYHKRLKHLNDDKKLEIKKAQLNTLKEYFHQINPKINIETNKSNELFKIIWPIKENPLVSIIIPTYNGYTLTKQAITSILNKTSYTNYEIILVDNNSNDPIALNYFNELKKHPKISVLRYAKPFNYSAINNFAVKHANGQVLALVNNDIEVINSEWLGEMLQHAVRKDIGCVGAMLYYPNETIQHAGIITGIGGVADHSHKNFNRGESGYFSRLKSVQNLSAVTAACLLLRKSVFDEVNGLNESNLKIAFNDVDLCLKVKNIGYRNLWTPHAELYHHESISRGAEDTPEKIKRFNKEVQYMKKTWNTDTLGDPFYNCNLVDTYSANFTIKDSI